MPHLRSLILAWFALVFLVLPACSQAQVVPLPTSSVPGPIEEPGDLPGEVPGPDSQPGRVPGPDEQPIEVPPLTDAVNPARLAWYGLLLAAGIFYAARAGQTSAA